MLLRYIFGNDVFISYSRKDGRQYATKLKEQLGSMDYSCFIDFEKVYPGDHLSGRLQRALKRSRVLVVVGTKGARHSPYVRQEIDEFLKTGRTLIPIDIQDALVNPQWDVLAANELVWIDDAQAEAPSPEIFQEIKRLFKYNRRNVWVRTAITSAALVLLAISVVAVLMAMRARASQLEAERQTAALKTEQQRVREQTAELLANQQELAARNKELEDKNEALNSKTEEADRERRAAQENAARAQRQEQAALRNAERARQQEQLADERQKLADERQKLAFSRELSSNAISQLPFDAELGLLLASHAMEVSPTREAVDALRQALAVYPARAVLVGEDCRVDNGVFSSDSRLVVTTGSCDSALVWDTRTWKRLAKLTTPDGTHILRASFSPDGGLVAGGNSDGKVLVWETASGHLLKTLSGQQGSVGDVGFSPDLKFVVTASLDGTMRVWDINDGSSVRLGAPGSDQVKLVRFNPDGRRIATAGESAKVQLLDAKTGAVLKVFDAAAGPVSSVEFSPDGKHLAFASSTSGFAQLCDLDTGEEKELGGYYHPISHVSFSSDGQHLVTTGDNSAIRIWKTDTRAEGFEKDLPAGASSARLSPDGRLLVTTNMNETAAQVWDVDAKALVGILRGHTERLADARFSPDGRFILTTSLDGTARAWKASLRHGPTKIEEEIINTPVFSPDGRLLVLPDNGLGTVARVIDTSTGKISTTLKGSTGSTMSASFSPDSRRIVTASDGGITVWDAAQGSVLKTMSGHMGFVNKAEFSHDGKMIVSVGEDAKVRLWRVETGSSVELLGHAGKVFDAAFSPDDRYLATAGEDKTARVWDVRTGRLLKTLGGHRGKVLSVRFSPDGKFVLTAGDETRVWQVETEKSVEMRCGQGSLSASFSVDGKYILTENTPAGLGLRVCEAASGKEIVLQGKPKDGLTRAAFSPDGRFVLGSGVDAGLVTEEQGTPKVLSRTGLTGTLRVVRVWELDTGKVVSELRDVSGPIAVSPDGSSVLVSRDNDVLYVYPWEALAPINDLRDTARRATLRSLSLQERQDYLHEQQGGAP